MVVTDSFGFSPLSFSLLIPYFVLSFWIPFGFFACFGSLRAIACLFFSFILICSLAFFFPLHLSVPCYSRASIFRVCIFFYSLHLSFRFAHSIVMRCNAIDHTVVVFYALSCSFIELNAFDFRIELTATPNRTNPNPSRFLVFHFFKIPFLHRITKEISNQTVN